MLLYIYKYKHLSCALKSVSESLLSKILHINGRWDVWKKKITAEIESMTMGAGLMRALKSFFLST